METIHFWKQGWNEVAQKEPQLVGTGFRWREGGSAATVLEKEERF